MGTELLELDHMPKEADAIMKLYAFILPMVPMTYRHGGYHDFFDFDHKSRLISAAP